MARTYAKWWPLCGTCMSQRYAATTGGANPRRAMHSWISGLFRQITCASDVRLLTRLANVLHERCNSFAAPASLAKAYHAEFCDPFGNSPSRASASCSFSFVLRFNRRAGAPWSNGARGQGHRGGIRRTCRRVGAVPAGLACGGARLGPRYRKTGENGWRWDCPCCLGV